MIESSKLKGPNNYVVWNTKVKTTFSRKYLWDLIKPKGKKMLE